MSVTLHVSWVTRFWSWLFSWQRHKIVEMETLSALLTLCGGNHRSPEVQITWGFSYFLMLARTRWTTTNLTVTVRLLDFWHLTSLQYYPRLRIFIFQVSHRHWHRNLKPCISGPRVWSAESEQPSSPSCLADTSPAASHVNHPFVQNAAERATWWARCLRCSSNAKVFC